MLSFKKTGNSSASRTRDALHPELSVARGASRLGHLEKMLPAAQGAGSRETVLFFYSENGGSTENRMGFFVFGWVKESDTAARQRCFPISDEPQRPSGGDDW